MGFLAEDLTEVLDGEVWLVELQAEPAAGPACVGVGGVQAEDGVVLVEFVLPPTLGGVDVAGEGVAGLEVVGLEGDGAQVVEPGFFQGCGVLEAVVEVGVELAEEEVGVRVVRVEVDGADEVLLGGACEGDPGRPLDSGHALEAIPDEAGLEVFAYRGG